MPDYRERGQTGIGAVRTEGPARRIISGSCPAGRPICWHWPVRFLCSRTVLILDEPIAQLDPMHADRIYAVLRELNENHGKTIIVIEHHTEYIADYCKHVMLMKDGHGALDTAHRRSAPAGGGAARLQYLSAAGDPWRPTGCNKPGHSPGTSPLPTTVEEGKAMLCSKRRFPPRRTVRYTQPPRTEKPVVAFQNVSAVLPARSRASLTR